jgi:rhomboid protease GluP
MIGILVLAGLLLRATTPEDRQRYVQTAIAIAKHVRTQITRSRPELEAYRGLLNARTPHMVATPALIAINVAVFAGLLFGTGSMSDGQTLLRWGANFGPATTNGEWWRLLTATFVNPGLFQLTVAMLCLWQVGSVLERLIGRITFAAVYVASGLFTALFSISSRPLVASYGSYGSIAGLYGLLISSTLICVRRQSELAMPRLAAKRLGAGALLFGLFSLFAGGHTLGGELAAVVVGLVAGAVLTGSIIDGELQPQRLLVTFGCNLIAAVAFAVPMRGITDARAEMKRLVSTEDHTVATYKTAVDAFRRGKMTADAMAQYIDRTIVPELQAAETRIKALNGVPAEQQPLVAGAEEYLRLRQESWRLRADGLRKTRAPARGDSTPVNDANWRLRAEAQYRKNAVTLGKAEGAERASLEVLEKIKS